MFLLILLCSSSPTFAKEVTVDGVGIDRESALRDARRVAVEQVVGTFVDSRTLVENSMVALDNIYTKSQGFVGKVTVINSGNLCGGIGLQLLDCREMIDAGRSREEIEACFADSRYNTS